MNLLLRLLRVIIHGFFRSRIGFFDASTVKFRVLPNDLDLNWHMTNSRYLSIMDLGRVDLLIRSGLVRGLMKHKWQAVLGSAQLRFRRSLKPFQSYQIRTHLIGADEKWFYLEQRFEKDGQLVAYGLVKAIFVSKSGSVPVEDVIKELQIDQPLPPLRDALVLWNQMDSAIKKDDIKRNGAARPNRRWND